MILNRKNHWQSLELENQSHTLLSSQACTLSLVSLSTTQPPTHNPPLSSIAQWPCRLPIIFQKSKVTEETERGVRAVSYFLSPTISFFNSSPIDLYLPQSSQVLLARHLIFVIDCVLNNVFDDQDYGVSFLIIWISRFFGVFFWFVCLFGFFPPRPFFFGSFVFFFLCMLVELWREMGSGRPI